ncbi:hypothetical protein N9254_02060 [Flavobacteriaceae bacterium]|nr:hypothetical protein [Flavobacteriaceae bacterium]
MKKLTSLLLLICTLSFCNLSSQEILTNKSVIELVELGFEESVIIAKIESSETNFDTTIEKLRELKSKGATPNILKAMMSPSKNEPEAKEPIKKQQAPKPTDTEFYWENGENELVKVQYVNSNIIIDEGELSGYTYRIMTEAKFGLKNGLSFRPSMLFLRKRVSSDKVLTDNDKTDYIIQLSYYGSNSYGAMVDGIKLIGVNPTVKSTEPINDDDNIGEAQEFTFKSIRMDGRKMKMKGEIHIYRDYLDMIVNKTAFSPESKVRMPTPDKTIISENNWKLSSSFNGVYTEMVYDSNDNNYKNNGGTLKIIAAGYTQLYILNKKE